MEEEKSKKESLEKFNALSFAFELGYLIAGPIVFFGLVGRFLDKYLNSSPYFLLGGILLSLLISVFLVYKKAIKILNN